MAKMWPRLLPLDVLHDPLRSTECRVFNKLETELGAEFTVFYSRPWYGLTISGEEVDGECDFLVTHPHHGILCIEVKGGRIQYNPGNDQWVSIDRYDTAHIIKNPIAQASRSKYHLRQKLSNSADWPKGKVHVTHGVIFPDCKVPSNDLGPDGPREIFCDREQFDDELRAWVKLRLLTGNAGTKELGNKGLQAIEDILAKPIHLHRPLAFDIKDAEATFKTLTQNQFLILRTIRNIPRAAIAGGAGTGKTVLAIEEAVRCSQSGLATLYVCFNTHLAKKARHDLQGYSKIEAYTFHSICGWMAKKVGLVPDETDLAKFYDDLLPEALLDATELLPSERYDAIIVDEGQDFKAHWWPALNALLRDHQSKLRVFWDNNQAVYGTPSLPEHTSAIDIPLDRNLRNTRQIFETIYSLYKGVEVVSAGPDGPPVEWREVKNHDAAIKEAAEVIRRLLSSEEVKPSQVAVTSDMRANEILTGLSKAVPQKQFKPYGGPKSDNSVIVDTIKRLKGLEFPVVIIICTDSLSRDISMQYIALSRAKTKLIVIGTKEHFQMFNTRKN